MLRFGILACRVLRLRFVVPTVTILLLTACGASATAHAQAAYGSSIATVSLGNGFNAPGGVAVDGHGNVFVADTFNSAVKEIVAGSNGNPAGVVSTNSTVNTVGSGFSFPWGVAVDGSGNVFVADTANNAVKEIVAVGGVVNSTSTVNLVGSGFADPQGVAVDGSGDVFVADTANNAVKEIVAVGGVVSTGSTVNTVGSGFDGPYGVAVDGSGNVFFGNRLNNMVKEIVAGSNGNPAGMVSASSTVNTLASNARFNNPYDVAVDGGGNVYVGNAGEPMVKEILADSNGNPTGIVSATSAVVALGSFPPFANPSGVAVDGSGNLFVADYGENAVYEIVRSPQFPTTAVSSTSAALTMDFTFNTAGTLASATPFVVLAQGKDFQAATPQRMDACVGGTAYAAGAVCTVSVEFTPTRPYLRTGAVQLIAPTGTPIATFQLHGSGTGPQVAFPPGVQTSVGSGVGNPTGVAVDGSGNVFATDFYSNAVYEIVAGSNGNPAGVVSATSTVIMLGISGNINGSQGLAVDASGNIFVAEYTNGVVYEIMAGSNGNPAGVVSATSTVNTVGSGFISPYALAVDRNGNLFVADGTAGVLYEILAVHGVVSSNSPMNTVGNGFNSPSGVAVDRSGNVFVGDTYNNAVKEIVAGTGGNAPGVVSTTSTVNTVGSGFNNPYGVVVDGSGNIYVGDLLNQAVKEIVAGTGGNPAGVVSSSSTVIALGSGFNFPDGVAVDGNGNLFIADGSPFVTEIAVNPPPSLTFAPTAVGSTSSDSPQTVTLENIGNEPLSLPAPASILSPNFTLGSSATCPMDDTSSSPGMLAMQTSCTLSVSFTPTMAGPLSGSQVLNDNNLNATTAPATMQTIPLNGTGIQITISPATLPAPMVGTVYNQTITASGGTGPYTFSISAGTLPTGLTLNATTGVISGTPTASGRFNFTATATDGNDFTGRQAYTLTVALLDFTFTDMGASGYTAAPGAVATYHFALAPLNVTYPGPVSFSVMGLPPGATASITPSTVAANGGATPVMMTVQTAAATAQNHRSDTPIGRGIVLALLLLPFGMKRSLRKKLNGRMLLLLLLLAGTAAVSGCGPNNGFFLQSSQAYTLTVTATSGALAHSQTVTLIVQ